MKRILTVFLSLLMVLPLFGCATAGDAAESTALPTDSIAGEELSKLASTNSFSKTVAVDDGYVRSGKYANEVMKIEGGILEIKNTTGDYRRDILMRFDLSKMDLEGMNRVQILLDFESGNFDAADKTAKERPTVVAYGVSNDWTSETLTYNNAPAYASAAPVGQGIIPETGLCIIDVTDYVMERYEAGETMVSFRFLEKTSRVSQGYVFSRTCDYPLRCPVLRADTLVDSDCMNAVLENDSANKALWDYAEELYDDWYGRYQEILAKGDYDSERITSNAADFSVTTQARAGKPTAELETFKTRLISTLSGYKTETREEDLYGGDMSAERQEATGRFYTKKLDGRWWVIDPEGYPCYVRGINHMNYSYQYGSPYQEEQMLKIYGSGEKWAIAATRWLQKNYHMNVASERHTLVEGVEDGMSYIVSAAGITGYARKLGIVYKGTPTQLMYNNTMPVFDPEFSAYVDEENAKRIAGYKDKTRIFGYTSDNEILFSTTALYQYLTLDYTVNGNLYSYVTAWTWYKNFTGEENPRVADIAKYSEELGVDLQSLFQGFVYDRYFNVVSTAVKKYDPDAMYLGARSLTGSAKDEWYLRTLGYWCDMYCVNYYHAWEIDTELLYDMGRWLGKPFLITEFYAKAMDAESPLGGPYPNLDGAGWLVATQTDRGNFYQNFCLRLLECKNCVGWMYFQYIDNDPHVNPEASNKGMINCDHNTEVYEDQNRQIALINENVYGLIEFFDAK